MKMILNTTVVISLRELLIDTTNTFHDGKPAAFDISVVSPLNSNVLSAAGARAGAASEAAELRKHTANDAKCGGVLWGMGQGGSAIFF